MIVGIGWLVLILWVWLLVSAIVENIEEYSFPRITLGLTNCVFEIFIITPMFFNSIFNYLNIDASVTLGQSIWLSMAIRFFLYDQSLKVRVSKLEKQVFKNKSISDFLKGKFDKKS